MTTALHSHRAAGTLTTAGDRHPARPDPDAAEGRKR